MSATVVPFEDKFLPEISEIFFESSTKKSFKDEEERNNFFEKYCGFYLKTYPGLALVALVNGKVMGYVVGSPVSDSKEIGALQPHMPVFEKYFHSYPSHLHINCHFESRGLGIGRLLVTALEEKLKALNIRGLHIMTGIDSENKNFYQRLGFDFTVELPFQGVSILFMGKRL